MTVTRQSGRSPVVLFVLTALVAALAAALPAAPAHAKLPDGWTAGIFNASSGKQVVPDKNRPDPEWSVCKGDKGFPCGLLLDVESQTYRQSVYITEYRGSFSVAEVVTNPDTGDLDSFVAVLTGPVRGRVRVTRGPYEYGSRTRTLRMDSLGEIQHAGGYRFDITGWTGETQVPLRYHCEKAGRTVERTFDDGYNHSAGGPKLFTVQFTNVRYCFNGEEVHFTDAPEARLYVDGRYSGQLQGACGGIAKSDTNVHQPTVYITCNGLFSNKSFGTFPVKARDDRDGSSAFEIPPLVNFEVDLGTAGIVLQAPDTADQWRHYTLTVNAKGCHAVSGVGDPRVHCG